jgi:ring-1,2-phenylacetyl-CoA epoxidase subunit PaaA
VNDETTFFMALDQGHVVEAGDWMPEGYRQALIRLLTLHGVSELMGALPEKEWIPKAPTLPRRLALMAKVQDEIGHAQLLLRLVEDLLAPSGRTRDDILHDLFSGRQKFHNVFHMEVPTWADVGVIAWLVDGAAIITQGMLLKGSYGPYRRVLRRIVEEERAFCAVLEIAF